MQLSIWTSFYIDLTPRDAIVRLAELGWKDMELSAEHGEMATRGDDWKEQLQYLRTVYKDYGVTLWQIHSPLSLDVADQDPQTRKRDIETAVKWLHYSSVLNIPYLVIHPGGSKGAKTDEEEQLIFDLNFSAFSYLVKIAQELNVKICIENMQERENKDPKRFGAFIYDINELIENIGSDFLGICFDTSHANVTGLDMYNAINECGNRLMATHISDNDGSSDQHKTLFGGNINWSMVIKGMKDINYSNAFNLEIPGENRTPKIGSMLPLQVRDAKLKYTKELF
ncbi:MAG: sugar phosphate isomerase/epimerase family protein, partial [Candidatus Poribacteria bacterium]